MGIVVDSGVFILWERRGHSVEAQLGELDRPGFISVASASELLVGVHRANTSERRERRSRFVEGILNRFPILGIDLQVARIHAKLAAELAQTGTIIGYQDLWIAATALNYDHAVMTTNAREFSRIHDLEVISIDTT
ncbi:PIN domain-containing protein [Pirellulaceae bacterium SH449]